MRVRTFAGTRSWWEPMETTVESVERTDPLANQITHFAAVIRGEAEPICSARDGLKTLRVVETVVEAARTGSPVDIVGSIDGVVGVLGDRVTRPVSIDEMNEVIEGSWAGEQ